MRPWRAMTGANLAAAARRIAEERAGRAPVRAADLSQSARSTLSGICHMLIDSFSCCSEGGLKVSITEFLTLLGSMEKRVIRFDSSSEFYYLSRACLVKDESITIVLTGCFQRTFKE